MNEIKEPIQKRAIEKRSQLIEAAKIVFNRIGYHNTHIKDITSEAASSVGLFYKYFEDKNDIYLKVLNILFEKEMEIARDFQTQIIEAEDKRKIIRNYIEDRLSITAYKNIGEEFHVLSEKYEPIRSKKILFRETYLNIFKEILMELWESPTETSLEVGSKLIRCMIYSNTIEIDNLKDKDLKDIYIDNLTDILYRIIVLNN